MKLSTLINALVAIQRVNRMNGLGDAEVFVKSHDGQKYEAMDEVRALTANDAELGISALHFVGPNTPEFWRGEAQFHVRKDGSTRSIIPSLDRDVVTQTKEAVA